MRNTGRVGAAIALGAVLLSGAASAAGTSSLYYERTLLSIAGDRCRLFTPQVAAALAAASRQARGAALRAGFDAAELRATEGRARTMAMTVSCKSKDLTTAADRVRTAFEGYAHLFKMSFPGTLASWQADRSVSKVAVRWRLTQTAGGMTLGVTSDYPNGLTAVASAKAVAASGARLVMRDQTLAPSPYLDARNPTLAGRQAPRSATTAFLASGRGPAPEGLVPVGAVGAAFRFPAAAANALDDLDPREAIALELVYPASRGAERVETILFEVGDFAAGRAFLAAQP